MQEPLTSDRLVAALRGQAVTTPDPAEWSGLLATAREHGVLPLLAGRAADAGWDHDLLALLRPALAAEAALAIVRERELRRVLDALAACCDRPLLFKGSHLAFAVYPSPELRPRLDTDLLIREDDRESAARCLAALGYRPYPYVSGDVAFAQRPYWREDRTGARHTLDLHWRIANPKVFGHRLSYAELRAGALPVPGLGPNALGPSAPFALLIACMHRTAHHGNSDRLLWLYDIHLLASSMTARDWAQFGDAAAGKGLTAVVVDGLSQAAERFGTAVPDRGLDRLRADCQPDTPDLRIFLDGRPATIRVALSDLRHLRGWRERSRFLREHLFPSASYMAERYHVTTRALLPVLYAHRILTGAWKWM
jgi:hypothetical protein